MSVRARIVFKSGHVEEIVADELTLWRGGLTGQLRDVTWKQSDPSEPQLQYLRVEEIACVLRLPDQPDMRSIGS